MMYVAMLRNLMGTPTLIPQTMASPLSTVSITGLEEQLVYNLTIKSNNILGLGYSEPYLLCKL